MDGVALLGDVGYGVTSCYASWWYALQVLLVIGVCYVMLRPVVTLPT